MNYWEKMEKECSLCPRACRVDRRAGVRGYCGQDAALRAARAALHMWEEPCISGKEGSGAVFFSGCSLRCIFCQNHEISSEGAGRAITPDQLTRIFLELQAQGANNINLVTPTHFLSGIVPALEKAKGLGLKLPVVYNCGGYESAETLRELEGLVDIYLPDMKYADPELAGRFSACPDYVERSREALGEMMRQCPERFFDERGILRGGVIVRHLVLPGHVKNSLGVIRYLWETYGDRVLLSLMNQYTPLHTFKAAPELSRKVTRREYERVLDYALAVGFSDGYLQEGGTVSESFIPGFDGTGLDV